MKIRGKNKTKQNKTKPNNPNCLVPDNKEGFTVGASD